MIGEITQEKISEKLVDLEPYKIKNIDNFYFRNHPKDLNPETPRYLKYWKEFAKHSVEGKWVNDEGTWYWIPPKSYFYINYLTLEDKRRNAVHPTYRDIDRIIGRYITCCDGFSGFEGDHKYTCNKYVKKENEGLLRSVEKYRLTESCYIPGTEMLKEYIDPWEYLMHHYLIDVPTKAPMGRALWENPIQNICILSARAVGKSTSVFIGDFIHEWTFCGVKYEEDLVDSQRKFLFAMASTDSANLNRSISLIDSNMTRFPGRYKFPIMDNDPPPDFFGPYYKNTIGTWKVGQTVRHVEKDGSGNVTHVGAVVQARIITPDKTKIVAGDRFRRIYLEEAGFCEQIMEIHANCVDSLKLDGDRIGSFVMLGTSGDIKAFRQTNEIFSNPEAYEFFPIPNYWSNSEKGIGLFIPSYYGRREYADRNENTDILEAFKYIMSERKRERERKSSMAYAKMIMYHPVDPREMMRPSGDSILPKAEAQDALNKLDEFDLFKKKSIIGSLTYDKSANRGVRFIPDLANKLYPIITFETNTYPNTEGALIMYETPLSDPPKDLYWLLYDPAAQSGTGTSLHSVLVYKYSFSGNDNSLEDTIVGEWLGRLPTLEENWNMVMMIARYFDAKVFPEYNTPGFLDWCSQRKLMNFLQPENMALKREINPRAKSSAWRKGYRMDTRAKGWALNKLRDWLLEVKEFDSDGIPTKRVIDTIYSPRILEEIVAFDPDDGNYDHISSLLGLMILHNALNDIPKPKVVDKYSMDEYFYEAAEEVEYLTTYVRRTRAAILNY